MAFADPNAPFIARQIFTADSGQRVTINDDQHPNGIAFYSGSASELKPATIDPNTSGNVMSMILRSQEAVGHAGLHANFALQTLTDGSTFVETDADSIKNFASGTFTVGAPTINLGDATPGMDLQITADANSEAVIKNKDATFKTSADISFSNSWVDTAGARFAAYKDATGRIQLRGLMRNGTAAGMMTLPVGMRPPSNLDFVVQNKTTGGIASVSIGTSGAVAISTNFVANTMQVYLDGISFLSF